MDLPTKQQIEQEFGPIRDLLRRGREKLAQLRTEEGLAKQRAEAESLAMRRATWAELVKVAVLDLGLLADYADLEMAADWQSPEDRPNIEISVTVPGCSPIRAMYSYIYDRPSPAVVRMPAQGKWERKPHWIRSTAAGQWRVTRYHCGTDSDGCRYVGRDFEQARGDYPDDAAVALAMAEELWQAKLVLDHEAATYNANRAAAAERREQARTQREAAKSIGDRIEELLVELIERHVPEPARSE